MLTVPLADETGYIYGGLLVMQDISPLIEAEASRLELALAEERTRLLTEFISNMSHDLKTPLSIINTSLYVLENHPHPERRKDKITSIQTQVKHLEHMIDHILTISRLDHMMTLTTEQVDLNMMLRTIYDDLKPKIEIKKLEFSLNLHDNPIYIAADYTQLFRALLNIVENATYYTQEGSITVHTTTDNANQRAVIVVCDTGIGIASEDLPYIFERFYRANKARPISEGGTGLGLAISHRVIELHGGTIQVESTLHEGSCFRIGLPLSRLATSS